MAGAAALCKKIAKAPTIQNSQADYRKRLVRILNGSIKIDRVYAAQVLAAAQRPFESAPRSGHGASVQVVHIWSDTVLRFFKMFQELQFWCLT